jgi:hypothetical protein
MMSVYNIHENLIEVLLEMQSYPDVQAVLSKYDGKENNRINNNNKKIRIHK